MNNQKVGKFIAQTRRKKSLTQAQLGEMLGISDKAISKWERGISAPDITALQGLSDALGVSIAEILLGEEIKTTITTEEANNLTMSGIGFYKKIFRRRYTKIIGILIGIILVLSIGFSYLYLFTNYDQVQVYGLENETPDITFEGLLVKNQKENSIIITQLKYSKNDKGYIEEPVIKELEIELLIDKTSLFKQKKSFDSMAISDVLSRINISINESKVLNEYSIKDIKKEKVYMVMKYKKMDDINNEIIIPVHVKKRFSNNKLVY